jgi:hypothetical protein
MSPVVGADQAFIVIEGAEIQKYLDAVEVEGEAEMDQEAELENPDL